METLQLKPSYAPAIYSEGKIKTVNGVITLEDDVLRYFMNIIDQNSVAISVDTSLLTVQEGQTLTFEFSVYSSKQCTLNFDGFNAVQYPVWRGLTNFVIKKYAGTSKWELTFKNADYQRNEERVLVYEGLTKTGYYSADRCTNLNDIFNQSSIDQFYGSNRWDLYDNKKIYYHSTSGILMTKFQMNVNPNYSGRDYQYPTAIKIWGSNDNKNWTLIGHDPDPYSKYKKSEKYFLYTNFPENTYFKHFMIEFFAEGQNSCYLTYSYFWGYKDPNVPFVYKRIIPHMGDYSQSGAQVVFDTTTGTSWSAPSTVFPLYLGAASASANWVNNDKSKPLTIYMKTNTPRIPELIAILHLAQYNNFPANYWKLYASNDETLESGDTEETQETFQAKNWELIACTQKGGQYFYNGEQEYKEIDCHKEYKYFKFEIITTYYSTAGWYSQGIFLYYKDYGGNIPEFDSFIPKLSSTSQDGYMVSCSSEDDGGVLNAFNKEINSYCGGQISTTTGDWILTMKLATKTIVKTLALYAPNSEVNRMPRDFIIEASQDTSEWTQLFSTVNEDYWSANEGRAWTFENETAYLWYRLRVTGTYHGSRVRIGEIALGTQEKIPPQGYYTDTKIMPIMTSNEQDGYKVTASSYATGQRAYLPWMAFDGGTYGWGVNNTAGWLKIELPKAQPFTDMTIVNHWGSGENVENFTFAGSNDDVNYTQIVSETGLTWGDHASKQYNFTNPTSYKYYKLDISRANSGWMGIAELTLINRTYNWAGEIIQGIPITRRRLVPVMTSDSQNGYIVTASSVWNTNGAPAYRAFNGAVSGESDNWQTSQTTDANKQCTNVWIQIQLPNPRVCNLLILKPRGDWATCKPRTPKAFTFNGSNDGNNWTELLNVTDGGGYDTDKTFDVSNTELYKFYRMNITETYVANQEISIGELELYKKEGIELTC